MLPQFHTITDRTIEKSGTLYKGEQQAARAIISNTYFPVNFTSITRCGKQLKGRNFSISQPSIKQPRPREPFDPESATPSSDAINQTDNINKLTDRVLTRKTPQEKDHACSAKGDLSRFTGFCSLNKGEINRRRSLVNQFHHRLGLALRPSPATHLDFRWSIFRVI